MFDTMMSGIQRFFMETSYVARVYADSLRDNFVGFTPLDPQRFAALEAEFVHELKQPKPYLAKFLRIESALVEFLPDDVVKARFWAVDDRFRRVLPAATCDRYDRSVPGRGDACWSSAPFLRDQTRALLDSVHGNYLVNIGREKSLKRLKTIMSAAALAIALSGLTIGSLNPSSFKMGILMLIGAGIFGALLSIVNRMQSAVRVDAMTQDGIYELTGLRVGWVGILMSFVLGGGFALVLYCIVIGGLLDLALPTVIAATPPLSGGNTTSAAVFSRASSGAAENAPAEKPTGNLGSDPVSSASTPRLDSPAAPSAKNPDGGTASMTPSVRCTAGSIATGCGEIGASIPRALGFADIPSFFKMLVLAFLAGFAERFVPDILGRLSKQPAKS